MSEVKLNRHGTNANIVGHILPDKEMKKLRFNKNYYEGTEHEQYSLYWYMLDSIKFKDKKYKGVDIGVTVKIYKDDCSVCVDVLDEDFGQPYDYQRMLQRDPGFEPALIVKEQVEEILDKLQKAGVLSGHEYGEYI